MEALLDTGTLGGSLLFAVSGFCNLLVHLLPVATEESSTLYRLLLQTINIGAGNFGKAENVKQ